MKRIKAFGQHFLSDKNLAREIAHSLQTCGAGDVVLEIGPGEGVLTEFLVEQDFDLYVVEYDKRLIPVLENRFPQLKDKIVQGDFLQLETAEVIKANEYAIIGNFPYQISTGILFKILEDRTRVNEMVGMFQKEVADRVAAGPGSKTYGITSVLVQSYYKVEKLFKAPPHLFDPPPKVHSSVIRLTKRELPLVESKYQDLRKVVKAAFNKRRKTLRNALANFGKKEDFQEELFSLRAEQLTIQQFDYLTQYLMKQ